MEKKKIMVVDDKRQMRKLLGDYLSLYGYKVTLCDNGIQALSQINKEEFDLIITDFKMPKMNGLELTRNIKASMSVPVIIMTGTPALLLGENPANIVINKPFDIEELIKTIEELINY